ncbi:hypothetical protein TURU_123228 [Turdus rufiventris]|nr:hypothetical protein TURU_123228 [Turdus rufiventris]
MGTSRQKEISLVLPIKIYMQYLNLGSFIYLSIAEIFFSSPTPRAAIEETYSRSMTKLAKTVSNYTQLGDQSQNDSSTKDFWMDMQAITLYLKKLSEHNPSASYYNVDVLKYQVKDLALPLVELHKIDTDPDLSPVKVPLNGVPSFQHVNHATQLSVIGKLAEGALNPTVHVTDTDVKQHQSQH